MNADELREKVARQLCFKNGMDPDLSLGGDGVNFLWMEYEEQARAAIATVIEACAEVARARYNIDASTAYDKRQAGLPDHHWCGGQSAAADIEANIRALSPKAE